MTEENPNTRLEAFSDGVVAVAITLLVLDIRLPDGVGELSDAQLWAALGAMWPRLMAFLISFAVIGVYWINHRAKFRYIVKSDRALLLINLLFLLFVCIVPFTTSLIAENSGAVGTAIYAGGMVACGLALTWLWLHAERAGLIDPGLPPQERQRLLLTTLLSSGVFAISVPISFAHPDGAKFFWLLLIPANLLLRFVAAAWWRLAHPGEPKPDRRSRGDNET
ncbi:MAG: TMEM175 family protein [Devosia sp.]